MLNQRLVAAGLGLVMLASACGSGGTDGATTGSPASTEAPESATTRVTNEAPADRVPGATDDGTENEFANPDEAQAMDLAVGDCFLADDVDAFWADEIVDCSLPHDGQAYALLDAGDTVPDDSYRYEAYPRCTTAYAETFGSEYVDNPGPLMSFLVDQGPDGQIVSPLVCALYTRLDGRLVGNLLTQDTAEVFPGLKATIEMEPGECFDLVDQFNVGETVECGPGALVTLGVIDAAADFAGQSFPGVDALRTYRSEHCIPLLADLADATGIEGDPAEVSGVIPDELEWEVWGLRKISCDVSWVAP